MSTTYRSIQYRQVPAINDNDFTGVMTMRHILMNLLLVVITLVGFSSQAIANTENVKYGYESVEGVEIFYREVGDRSNPAIVLLHGFPSSSHQYREVLNVLSDDYYLIAPDNPGFGNSSFPSTDEYTYTFDNIAMTMDQFLVQRDIKKYTLMIHDYGAPVGLRIATAHPERVQALITKNGNTYEEGIAPGGWGPVVQYWDTKTPEIEKDIIENVFSFEGMRWQYTRHA